MTTASNSNEERLFEINSKYWTEDFKTEVKNVISGIGDNSHPFPHFSLEDFLINKNTVERLRSELKQSNWSRKENDLYSLNQTSDLKNFEVEKFPVLRAFQCFMQNDVKNWLTSTTGVNLNDKVAITGSEYKETDLLLPHDDRLEERKFAFIFYLTPDWKDEFGGRLNLYDHVPEENRPASVAKFLVPKANNFIFFQVKANSWHAVSEVTSNEHPRLSLNGWFHSDNTPAAPEPKPETSLPRVKPSLDITLADVYEYISQNYTRPDEQKRIKRRFAAQSELNLQNFLNPEKYQAILDELKSRPFALIGPPDKRNVSRLDETNLEDNSSLKTLLNLCRSEALTLLLTQWTGLKLYDIKQRNEPAQKRIKLDQNHSGNTGSGQSNSNDVELIYFVDRYEHGSYSLCDDQLAADSANNGFCLDLLLFFTEDEKWPEDAGGFISYVGVNDPNEILRVTPTPNSAAIVFREPEVLHFTKYVNLRAGSRRYYILNCSFFGISNEDSESEDSFDDEEVIFDEMDEIEDDYLDHEIDEDVPEE